MDLQTLRHSVSHIMAQAVKEIWPDAKLGIGPSIDDGFYYDFDKKEPFAPEDIEKIEKKMNHIIKQNLKFQREELDKKDAIKLFKALKEKYKVDLENLKFYRGRGCEKCNNIGYKGRIGVYEVMAMNAEIEKVVLSEKVSEYDMQDIAIKNGMVTMVQDGLIKAVGGITSVSEVFENAE